MKDFKGIEVGDKLQIRDDLEIDEWYGSDTVVDEMMPFAGKVVTVKEISDHTVEPSVYINEDDGDWNWTPEMFEG